MTMSRFWLTTSSGRAFDFANPKPEMVSLDDIVHHLSRENRWYGNIETASFTVAQHTLIAASACRLVSSRPYALLHDAPEYVTRDLATPWKLWLMDQGADVVGLECRILHEAIYPAFNLPLPSQAILDDVDQADQVALATEYRDIVKGKHPDWRPEAVPLPARIKFMAQPKVEEAFRKALEGALRPFGALAA
ncbi:hypothetical protein [Devosia sp. Root635]|uniref:hypothetical protein n=1 Tax=Devosia sp. Root635 TaxID=1736575 RepID=UPI0006FBC2DF|nr:hypothetical protein [Devosia sp. Root635]KRA44669.1 hypothetical protein ASD80_05875 [Devosia sp. Root635]